MNAESPRPQLPTIAETLAAYDAKTPEQQQDMIDHEIGVLNIAEGLRTYDYQLRNEGVERVHAVADRQVERIFGKSKEQ